MGKQSYEKFETKSEHFRLNYDTSNPFITVHTLKENGFTGSQYIFFNVDDLDELIKSLSEFKKEIEGEV